MSKYNILAKHYWLLLIMLILPMSSISQNNTHEFPHLNSGNKDYFFELKYGWYKANVDGSVKMNIFDLSEITFLEIESGLVAIKINGKWGFIDLKGDIAIPAVYDNVKPFSRGLAAVCIDGKWGYIDKKNKLIIPCQYTSASYFEDNPSTFIGVTFVVDNHGKHHLIDGRGNDVNSMAFEDSGEWKHGLCPVIKDGKWGFINRKGEIKIQPQFDYAYGFSVSLPPVSAVMKGDKWGYITPRGEWVLTPQFEDGYESQDGMIRIKMQNGWGFMKLYGKEIIGPYQSIHQFRCGGVAVMKSGKWGYVDEKGNTIIPFIYDDVAGNTLESSLCHMAIPVKKGNKWGYIDSKGNTIVPFTYEKAYGLCSATRIATVNENNAINYLFFLEDNGVITYKKFRTYREAYEFSKKILKKEEEEFWNEFDEEFWY